ASSCARSSFFSASETDLSALSAAISFLICSGGSVNFLVCGSMPDMIIEIFIDASSYSSRLAKPLFLATAAARASTFVPIGGLVKLRHVRGGGDEALNMFLGELDLFCLLRSGRAGIKQSERQQRREQHTRQPPTRGRHRVSVSNERHGMTSILHTSLAPHNFGRGMTAHGSKPCPPTFTKMLCVYRRAACDRRPIAGCALAR